MTRKTKPKPFNLQTKITTALRRVWRFSPNRLDAIKRAKLSPKLVHCAHCKEVFNEKLCCVDHKIPCVSSNFVDWNTFIANLFCDCDGLQILCEKCHNIKTKKESDARKEYRKSLKPAKVKTVRNKKEKLTVNPLDFL
jgi:5-methylcytosine-specific restriction endonuclease McrA